MLLMARTVARARPKDARRTVARIVSYLGRAKFALVIVAVLAVASAGANLFGTYMVRPTVNGLAQGGVGLLGEQVTITAVVYAAGALSTLLYMQIMVRAAQQVVSGIRHDLFVHIQRLPLAYFDSVRAGDIMSLFTNDVDTVSEALNNSFANIIQALVQMVGTVVLLTVLNWRLALITLACDVVIAWYVRFSARRSRAHYMQQQDALADVDGYVEEMVSGQKVVKVFNREQRNVEGLIRRNDVLFRAGSSAQAYATSMMPVTMCISYANYAIVAVVGAMLALHGLADVGSLASYLVFVRQASQPINQFTQLGNFLLNALAGAERLFRAMELAPEDDEGCIELTETERGWAWCVRATEAVGEGLSNNTCEVPLRGDVRFSHVSFGYEPGHLVLKNLELYAKPGQKIAFVGSTGAGKTTIANLIERFYDVSEGSITFDGVAIQDISKSDLRKSIGIVLQDTHLFSGSIAQNIRFGKPDATDEEVREAARVACADSFIRRLPQSYDTQISADGGSLSQGQRQLLAIARVAIADPPVLILDEATSSIDTRTEKLIERGMDRIMRGRTTFMIAHRLSTVRNADCIMVLSHGCIVERGTHDELYQQRGEYWQLCQGLKELD